MGEGLRQMSATWGGSANMTKFLSFLIQPPPPPSHRQARRWSAIQTSCGLRLYTNHWRKVYASKVKFLLYHGYVKMKSRRANNIRITSWSTEFTPAHSMHPPPPSRSPEKNLERKKVKRGILRRVHFAHGLRKKMLHVQFEQGSKTVFTVLFMFFL